MLRSYVSTGYGIENYPFALTAASLVIWITAIRKGNLSKFRLHAKVDFLRIFRRLIDPYHYIYVAVS